MLAEEAEAKVAEIGRDGIEWHLIGHLQSNKVRKAVKLFDVIHTLDSVELAERIERICLEEEIETISVLIQVDLGRESTKNGIKEEDLPKLLEFVKNCKCLKVIGLMQIPPYFEEVEKVPRTNRGKFRAVICNLNKETINKLPANSK